MADINTLTDALAAHHDPTWRLQQQLQESSPMTLTRPCAI